jgi:hypothetical protein
LVSDRQSGSLLVTVMDLFELGRRHVAKLAVHSRKPSRTFSVTTQKEVARQRGFLQLLTTSCLIIAAAS